MHKKPEPGPIVKSESVSSKYVHQRYSHFRFNGTIDVLPNPTWIFRLCVVKQADWNVITTVKNNGFVVAIDEYLRTDAVHTIQDRQQLQYSPPDLIPMAHAIMKRAVIEFMSRRKVIGGGRQHLGCIVCNAVSQLDGAEGGPE